MVFTISSAMRSRPPFRKAPARRPAIVLWPPSSNFASSPELSRIMAKDARASVAWLAKYRGEQSISAASSEYKRSSSLSSRSAGGGREALRSSSDVPYGSLVTLFLPLGERTASCRGTVQLPPCRDRDSSGDRHQFFPKRVCRYMAAKRQNDAYHAVLSPLLSSGRLGMYQPLITSCRKPLARRRSLWTRVMSFARMAAAPLAFCRPRRISRDSASFSEGEAISVLKLVFDVALILVYCVSLILVYCVVS